EGSHYLESLDASPSVIIFTTTVAEAVYTSKALKELFDFSRTTPEEYAKGMRKQLVHSMRSLGIPNASQIAQISVEPVAKYHKTLSFWLVLRIKANTAAKFLYVKGILNEDNAAKLALTFADFMERNAKRLHKSRDPEWRFKSLTNGFFQISKSLHLVTKENARLAAVINANEWKCSGQF
ncbi:uncharacterized protein NPIL_315251, partial [Nephila pilipes]